MSTTITVDSKHPTSISFTFLWDPLNPAAMDTIQLMKDKHTASVHVYTPITNECINIGHIIIQESFNVLDCGIYRVISRRGSQSDEETSSLINQSTSEEERLKEFSFVQEEDQVDHGKRSCAAE